LAGFNITLTSVLSNIETHTTAFT